VNGFARRLLVRLAAGLVMVWVVATFTFFLVHSLPGNPGDAMYERLLAQGLSVEQAQAKVASAMGFSSHQPLLKQYGSYVWQLLHGNLGQSTSYSGQSVSSVIGAAAPWTIIPVLSGLLISFLIGVTAGVVAAVKRNSRWGGLLSMSGAVLAGIPSFVVALVLLLVFHAKLGWLPYGDTSDVTLEPGWNGPYAASVIVHAILPVMTYVVLSYGGWLLAMKSSVVSVLGDDFILASELRGIAPTTRMRYIGRNAILPLFTSFALSLGYMFGGAILIEDICDYPGLGNLLLKSIGARDYPLMAGAFLLTTIAIVLANILAELLYSVIDPRVRRT
jgi:peptide/nickel transport system permease protein